MKIKYSDVKEYRKYWVYTGEISIPVDRITVTDVFPDEVYCESDTMDYCPGPLADFAFFDNELEARKFAAKKMIKSASKNRKRLEVLGKEEREMENDRI
jgi:hypothetical protein